MLISERLAHESARDYAMRELKENIATLALAPGSMLSENELSASLGVSRTPIREALIDLSKIGIVEVLPQRGSRITLIDYKQIEESQFLRLTLEKAVVQLICEQSAQLDFSALKDNVRLQQFYLANGQSEKLMALDDDYHRELFVLTHKVLSYRLMRNMTLHFDRVRNLSLAVVKDAKIVSDHEALLEAMMVGDSVTAVALMEKHLSRYKIHADAIKEQYPEYFKAS